MGHAGGVGGAARAVHLWAARRGHPDQRQLGHQQPRGGPRPEADQPAAQLRPAGRHLVPPDLRQHDPAGHRPRLPGRGGIRAGPDPERCPGGRRPDPVHRGHPGPGAGPPLQTPPRGPGPGEPEAHRHPARRRHRRAETVALPAALILLLLIFGGVVAAGLPLGVGVLTILAGLAGTFLLSRVTDVSQYALNIVTLIGLGVAIDYSLFIVNRFRDELAAGSSREDALAKTMATAGRAITFSGITVAIGLSCMLFYQGTFLASTGAA